MKVLIRMKNDKIDVLLNGKSILKDYTISDFNNKQGTIAIGFNNLKVFFTNISLKVLNPPKSLSNNVTKVDLEEKDEAFMASMR